MGYYSQSVVSGPLQWIAVSLNFYGLRFIDASVYQMFRGSRLIFLGLLGRFFLKRTMTKNMVLGIVVTLVGVTFVSLSVTLFGKNHQATSVSSCSASTGTDVGATEAAHGHVSAAATTSSSSPQQQHMNTATCSNTAGGDAIDTNEKPSSKPILAVICLLGSAVIGSIHYTLQEKIFGLAPHTPTLLGIGLEGLAGILFAGVVALPLVMLFAPDL